MMCYLKSVTHVIRIKYFFSYKKRTSDFSIILGAMSSNIVIVLDAIENVVY